MAENKQEPTFVTPEQEQQVRDVYRQLGISDSPESPSSYVLEPLHIQLQKLGGLRYQGLTFTVSSSTSSAD